MEGRPPKPTALKAVEGNRGKRATNKQEPDPDYVEDLAPPAWLPRDAKKVWNNVAPKLRSAKLLTVVDIELLAMGCVSIAQYRHAVKQAGARLVIDKATADPADQVDAEDDAPRGACLNPWLIVQSMAFKQSMKVFTEFGMSPSSRTRLAIQPQQDLFGSDQAKRYFRNS